VARRTQALLLVLADQLEVDLLKRVERLADPQHAGADRHEGPSSRWRGDRRVGDGQDVAGGAVLVPAVDGREAGENAARVGQRNEGGDGERLGEQPAAELVRPAGRAQRRVQDRDAVARRAGRR
jgi:hypothetical protein